MVSNVRQVSISSAFTYTYEVPGCSILILINYRSLRVKIGLARSLHCRCSHKREKGDDLNEHRNSIFGVAISDRDNSIGPSSYS
jgi:hypothetical protein